MQNHHNLLASTRDFYVVEERMLFHFKFQKTNRVYNHNEEEKSLNKNQLPMNPFCLAKIDDMRMEENEYQYD